MRAFPAVTQPIYSGKAKTVYGTGDPALVVIEYRDDVTAGNGARRGRIPGKGACNNRISAHLFSVLERAGIATHFVAAVDDRRQLTRKVAVVPLEVVVRNAAAGSLSRRLGLAEGTPLPSPVVELYYKSDALGDPLVNRSHVAALGLVPPEVLDQLEAMALAVNAVLVPHLAAAGLRLVDCKLEFGWAGGRLLVADEISPDTCRLWDAATGDRLDKDRFRRGLGGEAEAYREVLRRLVPLSA